MIKLFSIVKSIKALDQWQYEKPSNSFLCYTLWVHVGPKGIAIRLKVNRLRVRLTEAGSFVYFRERRRISEALLEVNKMRILKLGIARYRISLYSWSVITGHVTQGCY